MNLLVDVANIIFVISYSVRDVLWLRTFAVIGGILLIPYYYLQPTPLMVPIYWGLVFIALNLFWVVRLLLERRPVKLSEEEQRLYQLVFRTLTPREMLQLLKFAKWEDRDTGDILQKEGETHDRISVIVSGRAMVSYAGDRHLGEIGEGQIVGKISFIFHPNPEAQERDATRRIERGKLITVTIFPPQKLVTVTIFSKPFVAQEELPAPSFPTTR